MRVGGENNWGKNPVRVRDLRRKLFYLFSRHDHLRSEGQKEGAMKKRNLGRTNMGSFFVDESLKIRPPSIPDSLDPAIERLLISEERSDTTIDLECDGAHLNNMINSSQIYQHIKARTSFINQAYFAALLGFSGYKGNKHGPSNKDRLAYVVMSNIVHARECKDIEDCNCKRACKSMCESRHRVLEFSCSPTTQVEEARVMPSLRYTFAPARALPRIARAFGFNKTWVDGEKDHFDPATWGGEWPSHLSQHNRAWQAFAGERTTTNGRQNGGVEEIYGGTIKAFINAHSEMMDNAGLREMKANEGQSLLPRKQESSRGASRCPSSAQPATDNLFKMDVLVGQWNQTSAPLLLRQLVLDPGVIAQDDAPPVTYAATHARLSILPEHVLQEHLSIKGVRVPKRMETENPFTVAYHRAESEMELVVSATPGRCLPVVSLFNDDEPFKLAEVGVGVKPGSGLDIALCVRRCDVRAIAADVDVNDVKGPKCGIDAPTMPAEGFARLLAEAEAEGQTRSDKLHSILRRRVVITLPPSVDENDRQSGE